MFPHPRANSASRSWRRFRLSRTSVRPLSRFLNDLRWPCGCSLAAAINEVEEWRKAMNDEFDFSREAELLGSGELEQESEMFEFEHDHEHDHEYDREHDHEYDREHDHETRLGDERETELATELLTISGEQEM